MTFVEVFWNLYRAHGEPGLHTNCLIKGLEGDPVPWLTLKQIAAACDAGYVYSLTCQFGHLPPLVLETIRERLCPFDFFI